MIAYVRGRLERSAANEVTIRTARGPIVAGIYGPVGDLDRGDAVVAAASTVPIGVADRDLTALLGPWSSESLDPAGPLGLASTPVLLLPDASGAAVARAGVDRAGREAAIGSIAGSTPSVGLELLASAAAGAEVLIVTAADGRLVDLVRILGGRAVVAVPSDLDALEDWLAAASLEAELPIPSADPGLWAAIAPLGLERTHQVVHVDPTPGLDEARILPGDASRGIRTAAAAGVLAGRIAAGNRRWRAALEP